MDIFSCQEAFGASDITTEGMRAALEEWFSLYYRDKVEDQEDPCQRVAYTVVNKLVRTVFAEYAAAGETPVTQQVLQALEDCREQAVALALVGGECYLKPCLEEDRFREYPLSEHRVGHLISVSPPKDPWYKDAADFLKHQ